MIGVGAALVCMVCGALLAALVCWRYVRQERRLREAAEAALAAERALLEPESGVCKSGDCNAV